MNQEQRIKAFLEYYNNKVADPDIFPKVFEYQVKLWKYLNNIK